jgi:hypothetical protein
VAAVFLTNEMLQQWSDQGKVRLDDTTLTLLAEARTVKLTPAVRFTSLIDGGDDPNKLLGKVKTKAQLDELGAEHYLDSVIFGDVGYTVVEGFLGDLSPAKRAAPAAAVPTTSTAPVPTSDPADDFHESTDVHLVKRSTTTGSMPAVAAPAMVDLPPAPAAAVAPPKTMTEAEALSQLFLLTVREK